MPTLSDSRMARRWTLCALYCAQGMPWGFVTVTLLAYLAERGADLDATARVTALATLPWSFKVVWGLVIDRFTFRSMGRRRPWVLLAQFAIGVTLLAMILDAESSVDMERFAWMVFLHNCFVSLQDVASDALAVDVLQDDERGRVNGLMWASNYLGSAIGGAGMGIVLARFGVQAAFLLQGSVLFAILCFPLFLRERAGEKLLPWTKGAAVRAPGEEVTQSVGDLVRKLRNAFRTWPPVIGVAYALSCQVMIGMFVTANPVFYTQELDWSQEQFSTLSGGLGAGAGVLGALLGGFVVDRVGVRRLIAVTAFLIAGCCAFAGLSPLMGTSVAIATGFLLAVNFLASAQTVASFSLFMGLCSLAVAGTQFTLYMAALNLTRAQGAHIVAALGDYGYGAVYIGMGVAMLVSVPILYAIPKAPRVVVPESSA